MISSLLRLVGLRPEFTINQFQGAGVQGPLVLPQYSNAIKACVK